MKTTLFFLTLVIVHAMSSCNFSANGEDSRRMQQQWNPQAGERISTSEAIEMMSSFKSEYPELNAGNYFDVDIYNYLTSLPGAVSVVTMFGMNEAGQLKCILYAVDKDFNYLSDGNGVVIYEVGGVCPPICPPEK